MPNSFPIKIPQDNVNDDTVQILTINFKNGDYAEKDSVLLTYETSKAVNEIVAPISGFVKFLYDEGKEVAVGATIVEINESADQNRKKNQSPNSTETPELADYIFSDEAKEVIKDNPVTIDEVKKTNKLFITANDIKGILCLKKNSNKILVKPENKPSNTKNMADYDETEISKLNISVVPMSKQKRAEINNLNRVNSSSLISNVQITINTQNIIPCLNKTPINLINSIAPVVIYETSKLLDKYPNINSFYLNGNIAAYRDVHIGYAVDIDSGLKVITIQNSNKKSVLEIDKELFDKIEKYQNNALSDNDVTGSTITITDLSSEFVSSFHPLVNDFQGGILGIGASNGLGFQTFSFSFDHRVMTGRDAARFLNELKNRIENYNFAYDIDSPLHCTKCLKTLKEDKEDGGIGFISVIDHFGKNQYICQLCMMGY